MKLIPRIAALSAVTTTFTTVSAWNGIAVPPRLARAAVSAAAAATILATAPFTAHAIDFSGQYSDPKHPNCKREIQYVDRTTVRVSGTDGTPGCPLDGSGKAWVLSGQIHGDLITVDFSPKGGPKSLQGIYDDVTSPESIKWPDGNSWTLKESKSGINLSQDPIM